MMNWFKKIFKKKEKEVKQFTPIPAQSYEEYISHMRRLDDQEFYDLYFNHPPIESSLPADDDRSIMAIMGIPEGLNTQDNSSYDSFGHGGSFGGGGASSSWDDNSSSNSSYDSGFDSGSSDNSSNDW